MTLSKHDKQRGLLLWFRLAHFYNQSVKASNEHLAAYDLSIAQFDVLVQIGAHQPITQQELAQKLLVSKGNITQLIRKMEDRELITRRQEWKTKYITLTEQGERLYQEVVPQQEQFQASQFQALSKEEQKQLLELLTKLQKQENF
ncbi:MarR family winged helix-turn-helix transcriptional regulator [Natribacillus halophilus]|uniref:DNA-binding transcriptional regulator, MarR family n=1 Tax=Natribacillus halophilus TaxID=549003 RepID=A0A1G8QG55_9BACI|nr:MarR family transcriptional regulator [Natribacillus halophilus]SDJ03752.1 DNA-binding transcriptional regulator, MarR family [Natribacillus halophilus]